MSLSKEIKPFKPMIPYPQRPLKKEDLVLQTLIGTLNEVKVSILLLKILKITPMYVKLLKDLVAHTHALGEFDYSNGVIVGGHCSTIIE